MEVALELEDDLFFADLSKQISLLIMDDDEDQVASYPSVSFQDFSRVNYPVAPCPFMFEQNRRRESKGTGVFIPSSSQPRRKHRQGNYRSSSNTIIRSRRQNYSSSRMISQASYNNNLNPNKVQGYTYASSTSACDSRNYSTN